MQFKEENFKIEKLLLYTHPKTFSPLFHRINLNENFLDEISNS
jgi:hypothetical protein